MNKTHKIRLNPTPEQANYFVRSAGTARFTYNWALAEWQRQYEAGQKPKANDLKKQFNAIKREQFPWVLEVTKCAAEQAFADLGKAFASFFKKQNRYPRFKSKKRSRASFYIANDKFTISDHWVKMPHIGNVNMAEPLRFQGKIMGARVVRLADWWFIAINVEMPDELPLSSDRPSVGIDVGINHLAMTSDHEAFENQRYLKTALRKLRHANKRLHRRVKGSKNREKARRKVARIHATITHLRDDMLQKLSTSIADTYAFIGTETLNLRGLMKNRKLSRSFADAAPGRLITLLETKVVWRGGILQKVGRFFPSTQRCHGCGWRWEDIPLSDRVFICQNTGMCPNAGVSIDRDWNAASNILQEALRLFSEAEKDKALR